MARAKAVEQHDQSELIASLQREIAALRSRLDAATGLDVGLQAIERRKAEIETTQRLAAERLQATIAASKNKGKYAYMIITRDYLLPVGPMYCNFEDPRDVREHYERFYRTKLNEKTQEILPIAEYNRRLAAAEEFVERDREEREHRRLAGTVHAVRRAG